MAGLLFHNFPFAFDFPPSIERLGQFEIQPAIVGVLFGVVPSIPIGLLQWLILRRYFSLSRWWILSIALGIGLMHFLGDGFPYAQDLSVAVFTSGALVGVFQWNLLRQAIGSSAWWVVASVMGWYLGWVIGFMILDSGGLGSLHYSQKHGLLGITIGLGYSMLVGLALVFLRQKNRSYVRVQNH